MVLSSGQPRLRTWKWLMAEFVCVNMLCDVQRTYFLPSQCFLNGLDGNTEKAD